MKTIQILLAAVLMIVGSQPAQAGLYELTGPGGVGTYTSGTISPNQIIADNAPEGGVGYGFNFSASGLTVGSLVLTINLSGGYNGDMYGYLQHGGTLIELFNPASFASGAGGSTLNLSLASGTGLPSLGSASAANLASGLTYAAAGNLNGFVGADPNGLWTLYFADKGAGDQMTLNSFNLSISAVPEPVNVALGGFFGLFGTIATIRMFRSSRRSLT